MQRRRHTRLCFRSPLFAFRSSHLQPARQANSAVFGEPARIRAAVTGTLDATEDESGPWFDLTFADHSMMMFGNNL